MAAKIILPRYDAQGSSLMKPWLVAILMWNHCSIAFGEHTAAWKSQLRGDNRSIIDFTKSKPLLMDVVSTTQGCYGAYLPNFPSCSGYTGCGYTCVGNYCAYAGTTCPCSCSSCAIYYPTMYLDSTTGTCVASTSAASVTGNYVGCFLDNKNNIRVLPTSLYSRQLGYQACFQQAQALGYRYVGLEAWNVGSQVGTNAGECWAGNSLTSAESLGITTNCAQVTSTDGSLTWGGGDAIALYDLWIVGNYVGCFVDDINAVRALSTILYYQKSSYQSCFQQARALGHRYVGLESWNVGNQYGTNTGECWAGDSLTSAESQGVSTNCAQVTSTDGSVTWGGGVAIALYDLTVNPIVTFAGTGLFGIGGDNGPATSSQLNYPWGLTVDKSGNVYVADNGNQKIRLISSIGIITTYAGTGTAGSGGDGGAATLAQLHNPEGLLAVGSSSVYIADRDNNKIRLVTNNVQILSVNVLGSVGMSPWSAATGGNPNAKWIWMNALGASSSYADITPYTFTGSFVSTSSYSGTIEVCADDLATVYFNGQLIQNINFFSWSTCKAGSAPQQQGVGVITGTNNIVVIARNQQGAAGLLLSIKSNTGNYVYSTDSTWTYQQKSSIITTYAGTGVAGSSGDGGLAANAQLHGPNGLAMDLSGNLYFSDYYNNKIRLITSAGIVTTYAGTGTQGSNGDGGKATNAQLYLSVRMNVDISGNVYIPDSKNSKIRMVNSAGIITTYAGTGTAGSNGDGAAATSAQLNNPSAVVFDTYGNVYIVDATNNKIRMVNSAGIITTFAGTGTIGSSGDGAAATSAQLNGPSSLAVDTSNNLYIADWGNNKIRLVVLPPPVQQVAAYDFETVASTTNWYYIQTTVGGSITVAGWTVVGTGASATTVSGFVGIVSSQNNIGFASPFPNSRNYMCWLQNSLSTSSTSSLSRSVTNTIVGSAYYVSFWYVCRYPGVYSGDTIGCQKDFTVVMDGVTVYSTAPTSSSWTQVSTNSHTATSTSMTLTFRSSNAGQLGVDTNMGIDQIAVWVSPPTLSPTRAPTALTFYPTLMPTSSLPSATLIIYPSLHPSTAYPTLSPTLAPTGSTSSFSYTGSSQTYTLPSSGCQSLQVTACGAAGGETTTISTPGYGACISGTLILPATVQSFYVMVGQIGAGYEPTANFGWNGGGVGGTNSGVCGGGGGGATDFRTSSSDLTTRFLVAAGGGGTGYDGDSTIINGGNGGSYLSSGVAGGYDTKYSSTLSSGGQGGTQTAGGGGGYLSGYSGTGNAGSFGYGGNGVASSNCGGGGGGGWYGGGSGYWTGGGGGSSYITPSYVGTVTSSLSTNTGNGYATITCVGSQPTMQPTSRPTSTPSINTQSLAPIPIDQQQPSVSISISQVSSQYTWI